MSETFDCPSCGAALDYDGGEQTTLRCLYCNTSVIVPEALRTPKPAAFSAASLDLGALTGQAAQRKEIAQLARSGEKIEAIKRYRALTKVGLKEAKDAVEALTEGRPVVMHSASVQSFDFSSEESDPAQSFSFSGEPQFIILSLSITDARKSVLVRYSPSCTVSVISNSSLRERLVSTCPKR